MNDNNCTYDTKIFWDKEKKKLYSEDYFLEKLQSGTLDSYILSKLARYFKTWRWEIDVIEDTEKMLTIQINGDNHVMSFQKDLLPKMLNETIFETHKVRGQSNQTRR